jgi:DNA-binding transcriptional ArsR family regulator
MPDPDFPEELCAFMQVCTPSLEAVELLLLLARHPEREWTAAELSEAVRPTAVSEAAVRDYLNDYSSCRLVEKRPEGRYVYAAEAATAEIVKALEKAYNERPVSLVRMIYTLKDQKIRSFADAFKIRKG